MKFDKEPRSEKQAIIIGGGPAGLTAAYELITRHQVRPIVLEKLDKVGGIARTENYKEYYFDMGGHRFFTKSKEVNEFWHEVMGNKFLRRPRLSRIFYNSKFFYYPLKPLNALSGLGLFEGILILLSYVKWQLFPYRQEETFEQWVTNRFGKRLFETFFKTYTEKVWGISCKELKAEWAAQRIKDLSLISAIVSMFVKPQTKITTLIEEFDYPSRGPGMMWTAVKEQIEQRGGVVQLNSDVVKIQRQNNRIQSVVVGCNGHQQTIPGTDFISSMPITEFIKKLDPPPPSAILEAAKQLKYRDFLTVCLIINREDLFPDNWIYIHDPSVKVGRIQNFKNWSPDMVPDLSKTSLGLEYFCNEGDELWNMSEADLIELGSREIEQIGLARYEDIEDGCVFRVPKSYPVYDSDYRHHLDTLKEYVESLENFQTIGRNGLHRYNNQDHAMLTGMLAVRNIVFGEQNNLWVVNAEQEYHEEIRDDAEKELEHVTEVVKETLAQVFAKLDPTAFGVSVGLAAGLTIFLATIILLVKGGEVIGTNMGLLSNFFPGYDVTALGSLLGLLYGSVTGFVVGWSVAFLRNTTMFLHLAFIQRRAELSTLGNVFDFIY
jgi:protoporphyrinogen oxidase